MAKLVQPIKWHGGKHYLAPWIISHFPPHLHYVEPYFGGGSVFLARDPNLNWFIDENWKRENGEKVPAAFRGCSEVVNDINGELTNFWQVLADPNLFDKLVRAVEATPLGQDAWRSAFSAEQGNCCPVQRAVEFFVRYRQSRQGLGKDFATLSRNRTRRGMNEQASSWLNAIEGLAGIHKRLQGVVILNDNALKVVSQQDGEKTLFYLDPPYLHETRSSTGEYEFEMSKAEHFALLDCLSRIKGKFILSGYHSKLYDDEAARFGWRCEEVQIDNKASSKKTKEQKTECLWMNF